MTQVAAGEKKQVKEKKFNKYVSYSQYSMYYKCPRSWKLAYIDNLRKKESNIHLVFGTSMHEVIQDWLTVLYEESGAKADQINLEEQFSPLIRLDFEMKNSVKIVTEIRKDRVLSLSFDNNLLTEIQGKEYIIGLGYRFKDVRIRSKMAGPGQIIKSDLNMKADISLRDNKTIIRYLDLENNQVTSGQTIWGIKYSADYAFSKNLTGIFYFDYSFSEYAISTAFPQTTIRSGITLRYNFGN